MFAGYVKELVGYCRQAVNSSWHANVSRNIDSYWLLAFVICSRDRRSVASQTFLLKVTRRNLDDTTSIVKTVPCFGSTTDTCLVEVRLCFICSFRIFDMFAR